MTAGQVLLQFGLPLLLAVIGYLLVDMRRAVKDHLQRHDGDIKDLSEHQARLQAELPAQYVKREDYIRHTAALDRKLDQIMELVGRQAWRRRDDVDA
jgi:hypothetical protein